jgi:Na+(H+)/acetate symporter ActP
VFRTNQQRAKDHKTYPIIVILLGQELAVDLVFGLVSFGAAAVVVVVVGGVFLVCVAFALQKSDTLETLLDQPFILIYKANDHRRTLSSLSSFPLLLSCK